MRLAALLAFLPSILLTLDGPIRITPAPNGVTLKLDRLQLTAPAKLEDATSEDEGILTVQLLPADPAARPPPAVSLALRFEPLVGDVKAVWTRQSNAVAFIFPCHAPGKQSENRLFIFRLTEQRVRPVALSDITTHLTRIRTDFAILSVEFQDTRGCFGWIGEDLLVVPFFGDCQFNDDIGGGESREISGHAVFHLDANGNATIREILSLSIQG
jgi:hypothetical protein